MAKKDCAFQYALGNPAIFQPVIIEETERITLQEAKELYNEYLPDFKRKLESGQEPEMAIWVDMASDYDYHTDKWHIDSNDMVLENGRMYQVVKTEIKEI